MTSSPPAYTFTPASYIKPVLHAAKHPSASVVGILLGKAEPGLNRVEVLDAVPLLHHWIDLAPMMQVGLEMVDIYASENDMQLVGVYVANARLDDKTVPPPVLAVANVLRKQLLQTVILVLDNENLASSSPAFIPYTSTSPTSPFSPSSTFSLPSFSVLDPSSPIHALQLVREGKHALIGDFDDHTEDVRIDWLRNKKLGL